VTPELSVILGLGLGTVSGIILARWLVVRPYNKAKREYDMVCEAAEKLKRMKT
jgi:hypothetical protein